MFFKNTCQLYLNYKIQITFVKVIKYKIRYMHFKYVVQSTCISIAKTLAGVKIQGVRQENSHWVRSFSGLAGRGRGRRKIGFSEEQCFQFWFPRSKSSAKKLRNLN